MAETSRYDLFLRISQNLKVRESSDLRTYVEGNKLLPGRDLEHMDPQQIFLKLEHGGQLGKGDLSLLVDLMTKINRVDLAEEAKQIAAKENKVSSDDADSSEESRSDEDSLIYSVLETGEKIFDEKVLQNLEKFESVLSNFREHVDAATSYLHSSCLKKPLKCKAKLRVIRRGEVLATKVSKGIFSGEKLMSKYGKIVKCFKLFCATLQKLEKGCVLCTLEFEDALNLKSFLRGYRDGKLSDTLTQELITEEMKQEGGPDLYVHVTLLVARDQGTARSDNEPMGTDRVPGDEEMQEDIPTAASGTQDQEASDSETTVTDHEPGYKKMQEDIPAAALVSQGHGASGGPVRTPTDDVTFIDSKDISVKEKIGEGTFGTVYLASYRGREVAAKKLGFEYYPWDLPEPARILRECVLEEAAIMQQIQDENLVRLIGVCLEPENYIIVMEYMPGGSLLSLLICNPPEASKQLLQLSTDAARGLCAIHHPKGNFPERVHGNLTTSKYLLDANMRVKLSDFCTTKTKTSVCRGRSTVPYVAPENLRDSNAPLTQSGEVFSFGIVLWEIASRRLAHDAIRYQENEIHKFVLEERRKEDIPYNCDKSLAAIIEMCRNFEDTMRPTMLDVVKLLEGALLACPSS